MKVDSLEPIIFLIIVVTILLFFAVVSHDYIIYKEKIIQELKNNMYQDYLLLSCKELEDKITLEIIENKDYWFPSIDEELHKAKNEVCK